MVAASPAKKKVAAAKKPADHPKYIDMISAAIAALKERGGSSRQAIYKHVKANNKVSDGANNHIKQALKKGVIANVLVQVKGTGASGSFKLAAKPKVVKPKKKPVVKKPAVKKAAPKKKAAAKKPAAKKAKTPTKAKKPAAKKPAKKAAAKKPAAKKAKKATPKKTAAKKTAAKK